MGEFWANVFSKALTTLLRLHTDLSVPRGQPWSWDSWPAFALIFVAVVPSFVDICVCTFVLACKRPEQGIQCLSLWLLTLFPWARVSHWPWNSLFWDSCLASEPQGATCSYSLTLRSQARAVPTFYVGTGDLNSGLHACRASSLIHGAISPATSPKFAHIPPM